MFIKYIKITKVKNKYNKNNFNNKKIIQIIFNPYIKKPINNLINKKIKIVMN